MFAYKLLYLISLVTFTFGALTFSVLAASYWGRWGGHPAPARKDLVFRVFTLVCAGAFLLNLLFWAADTLNAPAPWLTGLSTGVDLVSAFLPPLLFHVVYRREAATVRFPGAGKVLLAALYAAGALVAAAGAGPTAWADRWEAAPAWLLGLTGVAGLAILAGARPAEKPAQFFQRRWYRILLALTLLCALLHPVLPPAFSGLLADCLLLAFFCATLYYQERLVFFDLLIKRGAFFALSLAALTFFFATAPALYERFPADWSRPWITALLLLPLWLTAPWMYRRLAAAIDHVWLRRPYSAADAERRFVEGVQLSSTEAELLDRAAAGLGAIFQAKTRILFHPPLAVAAAPDCPEDGLVADIGRPEACAGWIVLAARRSTIPYLSDDRRLLQSLARILGATLESVRFRQQRRQQEERERELRHLASRAELKALRAQINPHFLFNALNAIAGLIPDQPRLADETVEQLAQVFRYTLRESEKEWARLDEEIEFVASYLRVEQARFGSRLRVEFAVDAAAHAVPVPAMSIQPLVENAIRHGVSAVEGPGAVVVRAALENGALRVEVFDNGPGFPPGYSLAAPGQNAHGLRNIAERLAGYYGGAAALWWENGPRGTRVFLKIPPRAEVLP